MKKKNTGKAYESFVAQLHKAILNCEGFESIKIEQDKKIKGSSGQKHQIDIYWEFTLAGMKHMVAIECKDYASRIDVGKVRNAIGLQEDIPGLQCILVTDVGFQSGAVTLARHNRIGLRVIREAKMSDYNGRIRQININMNILQNNAKSFIINITESFSNELNDSQKNKLSRLDLQLNTIIYLGRLGEVTVQELLAGLPETEEEVTVTRRLENAYLLDNEFRIPIDGYTVTYRTSKSTSNFQVGGEKLARAIVKDALTNNLIFIDDEERITGDVNEFFGKKLR